MTIVIQTTDVTKTYRMGKVAVPVLRGISLDIQRGEMVAIVGPSGSGKSTLLGLMGGLDTPTAGRVVIDDLDITAMNENQLAGVRSDRIGFVFQAYNLIPTLTALENVALPAQFAHQRKFKPMHRARELLITLGLGERLNHRPAALSGGEQQRVAIARALINHPAVVLADEPTGNLDSVSGKGVLEALERTRADTGTTLVLVTHDATVAACADRIFYLQDGRLLH
ncbi:MAG: ABC transporter ATP-binding protein [Anaerolineae bacterium]|jgi:putative ABC transport system ATP-binding protein